MKIINAKQLASDFDGYNYVFMNMLFQRYIRYLGKDSKEGLNTQGIKALVAEDTEMFNDCVARLFKIIIDNRIKIEPLKVEEIVSIGTISPLFNMILTYLSKFREGELFYMNVGNDDVLLFNLIKSIYRNDSELLADFKYSNSMNFNDIEEFIHLDKNEYKIMCKAIRGITLDGTNEIKEFVTDTENKTYYEMYAKHVLDSLKIIILENHIYGQGMLLYSKKLFTSKMVSLTLYCFGKSLDVFTANEQYRTDNSNTSNKYACFIVSEICKAMHFKIYGKYTNGDIIESYDIYVEKFMRRNRHLWDSSMINSVSLVSDYDELVDNMDECKLIKKKIKEVKNNLYTLRKSNESEHTKNVMSNIDTQQGETVIPEQEKTTSVDRQAKINKLKDNNVVVYANTELFKGYLDELDIKDASKFKGKTIDEKYKYVVKLTKGIDHAIGYDLNSEIDKTGAKLITCSRTNIDLILDSILNQIEE